MYKIEIIEYKENHGIVRVSLPVDNFGKMITYVDHNTYVCGEPLTKDWGYLTSGGHRTADQYCKQTDLEPLSVVANKIKTELIAVLENVCPTKSPAADTAKQILDLNEPI